MSKAPRRNYFRFWAKLPDGKDNLDRRDPKIEEGGPEAHLFPYHCLDVAACAHQILGDKARNHLAQLFVLWERACATEELKERPLDPEARKSLRKILILMFALHDLGKFDLAFQAMQFTNGDENPIARAFCRANLWPEGELPLYHSTNHHSIVGARLWTKGLAGGLFNPLRDALGVQWPSWRHDGFGELMCCVLAHHGERPHNLTPKNSVDQEDFRGFPSMQRDGFIPDILDFTRDLAAILEVTKEDFDRIPIPNLTDDDKAQCLVRLEDRLSFLAILADWTGSDSHVFRYDDRSSEQNTPESRQQTLRSYWVGAKRKAKTAISRSEYFHTVETQANQTLTDLFPHITTPTPLQQKVADLSVSELRPATLYLLEDTMGSGKTEAGLYLAHRLMRRKHPHNSHFRGSYLARGIYFALPTRATSDGIYRRLFGSLDKSKQEPSPYVVKTVGKDAVCVLSHSAASLSIRRDMFRKHTDPTLPAIEAQTQEGSDEGLPSELSATAARTQWAQSSKRCLSADFGVGTIDQVLMAVIRTKHYTFRRELLAHKTLIIDEAHSYDSYTFRLMCELVTHQISLGLSVIVLSATLSDSDRTALLDAAHKGARNFWGWTRKPKLSTDIEGWGHFPSVTLSASPRQVPPLGPLSPTIHPVDPVQKLQREVTLSAMNPEEALDTAIRESNAGKTVCLLANTIRKSQEWYTELRDRGVSPELCKLLHSRFIHPDRAAKEQWLNESFGNKSGAHSRKVGGCGKIIVSTQIVEQSLDVDFDVMITEAAPIAALLQRSGRVWRHPRDPSGNICSIECRDPGGFPQVHVLASDPNGITDPKGGTSFAEWRESCGGGARVYGVTPLWRVSKYLFDQKHLKILIPRDLRGTLSAVGGIPLPDEIQRLEDAEQERKDQQVGRASEEANLSDRYGKFTDSGTTSDEEGKAATRLGVPTIRIALSAWGADGRPHPWHDLGVALDSAHDPNAQMQVRWEDSVLLIPHYQLEIRQDPWNGPCCNSAHNSKRLFALPGKDKWNGLKDKARYTTLVFSSDPSSGTFLARAYRSTSNDNTKPLQPTEVRYDGEVGLEIVDI